MFENRKLVIATKHRKEKVVAPLLEKELGVKCFVDENFDTDTLGTFTGETARKLNPLDTAREKCLIAMQLNNCDMGVASEGSFGPHPSVFFMNADDEFLIFIDLKNQLEIVVRELSTDTNFNGQEISTEEELTEFARSAGFPAHGLILRPSKDNLSEIYKGITDPEDLKQIFQLLQSKYNSVYAETDMRAMFNPTRMKVIEKAAVKLIEKIKSTCPQCHTPGFGITEAKKGLECSLCGMPTNSTLSHVYVCLKCNYTKEAMYPHNKSSEDPMYCDYCNP
jgi:hypothetical protein